MNKNKYTQIYVKALHYIILYIKLTTIDNQAVNRVAIKGLVLASGIVLFAEGGQT